MTSAVRPEQAVGAGLVLAVLAIASCSEAVELPAIGVDESVASIAGTACITPIRATAVVIDDDLALTVAHAIAGAEDDLRVVTSDGAEHAVTVVGFDPERDLALLAVPTWDAPSLPLRNAAVDEWGRIAAMRPQLEPIPYRVSRIVNARSGDIYDEGAVERTALDIVADVGPGVSGAPLIDVGGNVAGVVFASSRSREGAAWALDISEIEAFLSSVDPTTEADRGRCR